MRIVNLLLYYMRLRLRILKRLKVYHADIFMHKYLTLLVYNYQSNRQINVNSLFKIKSPTFLRL